MRSLESSDRLLSWTYPAPSYACVWLACNPLHTTSTTQQPGVPPEGEPDGRRGCDAFAHHKRDRDVAHRNQSIHRRLLQEHLGEGYPSRTRVWRALALLVESGMIYCALLLAAVIDQIDQPTGPAGPTEPDSLFQNIITFFTYGCFVHIVAIYPVLIIVLVAMQRSPIDAGITQYLHLAADPSGTERNGERTSTLVFGPAEPGLSTFHDSMPDTIIELQARSKPQSDGQIEECATFDMGWDQGAAA
ncbi:hypothetical protein BD311DRAFT_661214 [Dichomitus squalens]|uniref:Uncharacterized protein n=1 Tax=Dichomitus squalens TaxID=114155 RepID=A0A4Q9MSU1_9APHY|nr:hypothetical protein BD311DRAFT_661214 [Dichomitus squalens]